jgi:serine/threonine protein kinase
MSTDTSARRNLSGTARDFPTPPARPADAGTLPQGLALEPLPEAIGKYRVLERLGAGAMGVVYKCCQPGLDRPVAVKVLVAAGHASGAQVLRFQREARAAALLTHPNVVQVFDVGSEGGLPYYVMEFVDGCSLAQLIATPALTVETSLRLVYHTARALEAAHEQGIIHRDIKPSNILLHKSGQLKLTDFGLAKSLHEGPGLSRSGDLIGTPRYMSPEQVLDAPEEIDGRTDIYSLGAVMYEMLTGKPPVDGPSVLAILRRLTDEEPIALRDLNPDVPPEVAAICERAMAKDRQGRFATPGQFAEAIQAYLLDKLLRIPDALGSLPPPLALPPMVPAGGRPSSRSWRRKAFVCAAVGLVAVALCVVVGLLGPGKDSEASRSAPPASEPDDLPALRSRALAQARQLLHGGPQPPENAPSCDRLRALLDDLSAVLKRAPEDQEIRLLRAQAYRRAGEYLAAIADASDFLRREPGNGAALTERLLASYQLYVLYLGNINELLLRPHCLDQLRGDIDVLRKRDPALKYAAELIQALARQDYHEAARIAEAGLPLGVPPDSVADWAMLEADALFHGAEMAYTEGEAADDEDKPFKVRRREELQSRATRALRRGLDADPNHIGVLFLKANSFQRRALWEANEKEDREAIIHRYKPAFESACDRLRSATVRIGPDTTIARAVLLSNLGWDDAALDQVKDALSSRPTVPYLHPFKAWLHLQVRTDSILTPDEAKQLVADLQPVFATSTEDFSLYFVRALLQAAAGQWEEARQDLKASRRLLGKDELPTRIATYKQWFGRANASTTEYLEATLELLWAIPVHADLRVRLATELLERLSDDATTRKEGLKGDRVKAMKGWTHFYLAQGFAAKEDRAHVLEHVREALQLQVPELNPAACRKDATLSAWNEDPEFKTLYSQYEKP